jgi:hypothetical protein
MLGEPCQQVRLSQDRIPIEPFTLLNNRVRWKVRSLVEVSMQVAPNRGMLGEPCHQVRLSQEKLPIEPLPCGIARRGEKEVSCWKPPCRWLLTG